MVLKFHVDSCSLVPVDSQSKVGVDDYVEANLGDFQLWVGVKLNGFSSNQMELLKVLPW